MLTGPDFHEEHTLDDGQRVSLRHIRPNDATEMAERFKQLTPASRYSRFHGTMGQLSPEMLRYLTNVDGTNHVAIVAVLVNDERGIGVARFVRSTSDPTIAEAAITVVDDMQHKGLGRILGLTLARAAIERGVHRFRGLILQNNLPVRELLTEAGAVIKGDDLDVVFEVDLLPPARDGSLDPFVRKLVRAIKRRAGVAREAQPERR